MLKEVDFQIPDWGELQQPPIPRLSYADEVMADSPVMYLRLNEPSGSVAHDWAGAHNAAVDGTVQWGLDGPLSYFGPTGMGGGWHGRVGH